MMSDILELLDIQWYMIYRYMHTTINNYRQCWCTDDRQPECIMIICKAGVSEKLFQSGLSLFTVWCLLKHWEDRCHITTCICRCTWLFNMIDIYVLYNRFNIFPVVYISYSWHLSPNIYNYIIWKMSPDCHMMWGLRSSCGGNPYSIACGSKCPGEIQASNVICHGSRKTIQGTPCTVSLLDMMFIQVSSHRLYTHATFYLWRYFLNLFWQQRA